MKRPKYSITFAEVRELLDYDDQTGIFRWRESPKVRRDYRGKVAGTVHNDGYRCIKVKGHQYYANVLAWFYVWGKWPSKQVDHRDGDRDHNALDNLREATPIQNSVNCKRSRKNTSGYKGVCRYKDKWMAQLRRKGKGRYLGLFDTPEEAHEAYTKAVTELHGEFARPDG